MNENKFMIPGDATDAEIEAMADDLIKAEEEKEKGGSGSGNFGHEGRPGERGGSGGEGSGAQNINDIPTGASLHNFVGETLGKMPEAKQKEIYDLAQQINSEGGGTPENYQRLNEFLNTENADRKTAFAVENTYDNSHNQNISRQSFEARTEPLRGRSMIGDEVQVLIDGKVVTGSLEAKESKPEDYNKPRPSPAERAVAPTQVKLPDGKIIEVPHNEVRMPVGGRRMREFKGGQGSGNYGHAGRPGERGGSGGGEAGNEASGVTEAERKDWQDQGVKLASKYEWDGQALLAIAGDSLEDANFHSEAKAVREMGQKVSSGQPSAEEAKQWYDDAVKISSGTEWDGYAIMQIMGNALEDANFHGEAKAVRDMAVKVLEEFPTKEKRIKKGGAGSGHFAHGGIPGQRGGSVPGMSAGDLSTAEKSDFDKLAPSAQKDYLLHRTAGTPHESAFCLAEPDVAFAKYKKVDPKDEQASEKNGKERA